VRFRDDKQGTSGKSFSHWDDVGHWLEWRVNVPGPGDCELLARYCTPTGASRQVSIDGRVQGTCTFAATGGFGSTASDWDHTSIAPRGTPVRLSPGDHTVRLENVDGKGLNLDYFALRPVK
jgi:hypothetical protein